jgi:ferredoxin--NADP+ reductase
VLKEVLEKGEAQLVVAIGPVPMMKFVSLMTKEYNVPTLVSLNPIMVDGTGMCGGCRVSVGGKTKFACVDGPEFDGHQVDYDELTLRLQSYCEDEKKCYEDFCVMDS